MLSNPRLLAAPWSKKTLKFDHSSPQPIHPTQTHRRLPADTAVIVLASPKAGRGGGRRQIEQLRQRLLDRGRSCVVTEDAAVVRRVVETDDPVLIVAAGGDGTLTMAAQIAAANDSAVLVPLPMGTENLLARRLMHLPTAVALDRTIEAGVVQRIDSMSVSTGRRQTLTLVMATAGFDAAVVRRVHLRRTGHIRRWTYAAPIIRSIADYPFGEIRVRTDGGDEVSCRWAMVFNLPAYAAGLPIAPAARADDGLLDVVCFTGDSVWDGFRYFAGILTGRHERFRDCVTFQSRRVELLADGRIPFQCDGDYAGRLPVTMECCPGAVAMLKSAYNPQPSADRSSAPLPKR